MSGYRELKPEELVWRLDESSFGFATTGDVEGRKQTIGQERALRSLDFGLGIKSTGYNIYVMGMPGTGKMTTVMGVLGKKAFEGPPPSDWLYVMDFKSPDKPMIIELPTGMGCDFEADMDNLFEQLKKAIPKAFEGEDYEKKRQDLYNKHNQETSALFDALNAEAHEKKFTLERSPRGLALVPLKDEGKPMTQEEYEAQDPDAKKRIEAVGAELQEKLNEVLRKAREMEKTLQEWLKGLNREFGEYAAGHFIGEYREKYKGFPKLAAYFDDLREDVLQHIDDFQAQSQQQPPMPFMPRAGTSFERYKVNLFVNNCAAAGTPVVYEPNPTYPNLFGRIEQKVQFGLATTDHTMIKPGALHRANGGYLVLNALDLLRNPFSYEGVKRAIKNGTAAVEDAVEQYRMVPLYTVKPEPMPLNVKIVLLGPPFLYYMLYNLDEEYRKLFKVRVDFDSRMERTGESVAAYAGYVATLVSGEGLLPFSPSGVARVVEHSARMVSDKEKLSARFSDIADLIREASYWSEQDNAGLVERRHVDKAVEEKVYRSSMLEEKVRQMIAEGTIKVDVEGAVRGQVNGLSVLSLGEYSFGRPSRITARVYMGRAGMVNIEREVKLSGPIHDKGVMILTGYLGDRYAQDRPLTLSASIAFEQSYEGVEGDSASSTELYALLSALSGLPIKQGIAVTGSVNQRGEVQAIGGVNEKLEGYFEVCKTKGLTGEQGAMIPESNVRHLMLKEEIVQAAIEGKFHVWAVADIDAGIEILTGVPAGERQADGSYPKGTVNFLVGERLKAIAKGLKEFGERKGEGGGEKDKAASERPDGP